MVRLNQNVKSSSSWDSLTWNFCKKLGFTKSKLNKQKRRRTFLGIAEEGLFYSKITNHCAFGGESFDKDEPSNSVPLPSMDNKFGNEPDSFPTKNLSLYFYFIQWNYIVY